MSNDFLQSSPSRNIIDPLIYNHIGEANSDDKGRSVGSSGGGGANVPSLPPSASKIHGGFSNFTGWTPLVSKTVSNEQLMSFNLTPNKYVVPHNFNQEMVDYSSGLNLTPFLNHNINLINNNQQNQLFSGMTPFHDKTLHLTDFFIDSPIRQTPIKDVNTITPSKFRLGSERKLFKQSFSHEVKAGQKRSAAHLDTPQKQPHKLSIMAEGPGSLNDDAVGNEHENANDSSISKRRYFFQTPSKGALSDITNLNKTPIKGVNAPTGFQTPAQPTQNSSPSTVIVSSISKSPNKFAGQENVDNPPSPTPTKEVNVLPCKKIITGDDLKPAMGVFSEKKPKQTYKSRPTTFRNMLNNTSNTTKTTADAVPDQQAYQKPKPSNKAQMQAGMNKFQIVFTDVHTLLNNKTRKKTNGNKMKRIVSMNDNMEHRNDRKGIERPNVSRRVVSSSNHLMHDNSVRSHMGQQAASHNVSTGQDHNVSVNSSKELSILSGNTSNMNMSCNTEHTSFEFNGVSSTPNGKFFLDKMFDKNSPQSGSLNQPYYQNNAFGNMPPPNRQNQPSHLRQNAHQSSAMMAMMSTPQHQNIANFSSNYQEHPDISPSFENSGMETNLSAFSYNGMLAYSKEQTAVQNPMINQQVLVPVMIDKSGSSDGRRSSNEIHHEK